MNSKLICQKFEIRVTDLYLAVLNQLQMEKAPLEQGNVLMMPCEINTNHGRMFGLFKELNNGSVPISIPLIIMTLPCWARTINTFLMKDGKISPGEEIKDLFINEEKQIIEVSTS
jgi:hypothetical protein